MLAMPVMLPACPVLVMLLANLPPGSCYQGTFSRGGSLPQLPVNLDWKSATRTNSVTAEFRASLSKVRRWLAGIWVPTEIYLSEVHSYCQCSSYMYADGGGGGGRL